MESLPQPQPIPEDVAEKIDGRYEYRNMLGQGGCGAVYLYCNPATGEKIAIKMESMSPNNRNKVLSKECYHMKQLNEKIPVRGSKGEKRVPLCFGDTFGKDYHCLKMEFVQHSVVEYLRDRSAGQSI